MNYPPAVTVIIPTYNSSGTLKLALETVRQQTFKDYEVWIVGDGCSDESGQVVASFGEDRFHWLNLPENSGTPSKPRNEGLRRAKGRYIAYLGHDDLWFPWHLEGLLGHVQQHECDFVYSLGAIVAPEGVTAFFSLPQSHKTKHCWLSPSNWMHDRSLIGEIGPWSLKVEVADDMEFLKRIRAHKKKIGYHQQLSVLKFPSNFWKMYSLSSGFPQKKYVAAMNGDAAGLRQDMLFEFASRLSTQYSGLKKRNRFIEPLFNFIRFLLRRYGNYRWPLNRLLYRRYRRRAGLPKKNGRDG